MTLEEAIKHAEEKAKCGGECGEEHAQLAMWLKELQKLRTVKTEKRNGKSAQNVSKEDLISRKAAIEAILSRTNCKSVRDLYEYNAEHDLHMMWTGGIVDAIDMVIGVPAAEPGIDEWCTDCSEYDHERQCCPRWNRVIRETLKDAQPERKTGKWIDCDGGIATCSSCGDRWGVYGVMKFCPNCGAYMGGEQDGSD